MIKDRPQLILPQEIAIVVAVLARHPKGRGYRLAVHKNQMIIYERLGPDVESLSAIFEELSPLPSVIMTKRLQEQLDKMARFSPILRFSLVNPEERKFYAERWSYFGVVDNWINIGEAGKLDKLVHRLIPKLGTDNFFELF